MIKNSGDYGLPAAVIIVTAILLPILSGLTIISGIRLSQSISGQQLDKDNPMAGTMKTMNMTIYLNIFMVFHCGDLGYWIISAVVRCVQQLMINKHLSKMSVDDLIEKNREKAAKNVRSVARRRRESMLWLRQIQRA